MQTIYPVALIFHLCFAVVFVGYLFFDVVIFALAKKRLDPDEAGKISRLISSKAIKIMPFCVLGLLLSGALLASKWINATEGYFSSTLQQILWLKILLAALIFAAVATNLSCKFLLRRPSPLGNIHPAALALACGIIICAKLMFFI